MLNHGRRREYLNRVLDETIVLLDGYCWKEIKRGRPGNSYIVIEERNARSHTRKRLARRRME